MEIIARIYNDLPEKFGLPRQSGMSEHLVSRIIMEKRYRVKEAFRGIEMYDHLWLLWGFDPFDKHGASADNETDSEKMSDDHAPESEKNEEAVRFIPTVRPPRLGGNVRLGVFATRSPNRPNRIGMSVVRLLACDLDAPEGPVLSVAGADMKSGTAIYDIKPYLPYADSYPKARCEIEEISRPDLAVVWDCDRGAALTELGRERILALEEILSMDPRPRYHDDPQRIYGMSYAGHEVRFSIKDDEVHVCALQQSAGA